MTDLPRPRALLSVSDKTGLTELARGLADRGFSSTEDYGLAVDTAGNALLAFRDDRGDFIQITAAKVSPAGTVLWEVPLADGPDVVMISYSFWQRRFGGAADAVGSTISMNGTPHTVVGVLPAGFYFLTNADIWRLTYRNGPGAEARTG